MGNTTGRYRPVVERKERLHKSLRRRGGRPDNLAVYRRDASVPSGETRPSLEPSAPAPSLPVEPARPDARTDVPTTTGRDRARGGRAVAADPARRMVPALAIVGSMCAGAMAGGLWTRSADDRPTMDEAPLAPENAVASLPLPSPVAPPPAMASVAPAGAVIEEDPDGVLDRHLDEIDVLRSANRDLEEQVRSLTRETLELNEELLRLEMEMVAIATPPPSPTEVRLVYNFVNVPIGGSSDTRSATTDEWDEPEPANEIDGGDAYPVEDAGADGGGEVVYDPVIDADGNLVEAYDSSTDVYGNPIDGYDPVFDAYGSLVDASDPGADGRGDAGDPMDPEGSGPEAPTPGARSMLR